MQNKIDLFFLKASPQVSSQTLSPMGGTVTWTGQTLSHRQTRKLLVVLWPPLKSSMAPQNLILYPWPPGGPLGPRLGTPALQGLFHRDAYSDSVYKSQLGINISNRLCADSYKSLSGTGRSLGYTLAFSQDGGTQSQKPTLICPALDLRKLFLMTLERSHKNQRRFVRRYLFLFYIAQGALNTEGMALHYCSPIQKRNRIVLNY